MGCDTESKSSCILHFDGQEDGWACAHHLLAINDQGIGEINSGECCDFLERSPGNDHWNCLRSRIEDAKERADIVFFGMHTLFGLSPSPHDYTWTTEEIERVSGYATGIEIINGGDKFLDRWDIALTAGNKILGFGVDDCEDLIGDVDLGSCNRSWIVVPLLKGSIQDYFTSEDKKDELKLDILNNIIAGNFYSVLRSPDKTPDTFDRSDLGPRLITSFDGVSLRVNTEGPFMEPVPQKISFIGQCGKNFSEVQNMSQANYELTGEELYVRVVVEQNRLGEIYQAYSQPFFPELNSGVDFKVVGCNTLKGGSLRIDFGCSDRYYLGEKETGIRTHFRIPLPKGSYSFDYKATGYEILSGGFSVENGYKDLGTIELKLEDRNMCF